MMAKRPAPVQQGCLVVLLLPFVVAFMLGVTALLAWGAQAGWNYAVVPLGAKAVTFPQAFVILLLLNLVASIFKGTRKKGD